ncbi:MAG: protein-methionine-sulfoxide reductase catalytic subunit MsrP [Chiayiivirga sp.]|jgi:sulfoxide reductase catalytic subunit YedY|uniref:protein-methionine-sulfoxide reductase catalytic subunit MsrP n=1 Tax=Chiayiivirga sp. TaxID=2041042 RepID=UPI0025BB903D|nr:protein-methionine-sulfoxide reductase catalytic subunit MsrP [Chiayiivirga sp.]MCI1729905.1 protein-methionine-sulfoxide reductase catalytic subunit MsrP [Chiayiivirga sp.]
MSRFHLPPIPGSRITPESVYSARRRLLGGLAASSLLSSPLLALSGCARAGDEEPAAVASTPDRTETTASPAGEELTRFQDASTYNNFYEFGTGKADPARYAGSLRPSPWSVEIAGHAELTGRFTLEDILKPHPVEERVYRLRCVEGWSMVIPWRGFALADLIRRFKPTAQAKYVAFTTLVDREQMPGQRHAVLDWPYVEGLRMDEAMHPLSLLATGMYGRDLPNQNGAPLRLVVPWKYGFKSIKSIVRIEFTERQPPTSWNEMQGREYGFYSNVNPDVDHPRWSQKTERRLAGSGSRLFANRIPTLPFNGYADQVAGLYAGMDLHKFF